MRPLRKLWGFGSLPADRLDYEFRVVRCGRLRAELPSGLDSGRRAAMVSAVSDAIEAAGLDVAYPSRVELKLVEDREAAVLCDSRPLTGPCLLVEVAPKSSLA